MNFNKNLAIYILILTSTSTHAGSICDRNSANTIAINACSEADFNASEARLNNAYRKVMASRILTLESTNVAEIHKYLTTAQRAWVAFRESDCLARDVASENTTLRTAYFSCMQLHAEIRTKQLLEYLNN